MELGIFDYALTLVIVLALPVYGMWEHGQLKQWIAAGVPNARIKSYKATIAIEWVVSLAVILLWVTAARAFPELGIGFATTRGAWIGGGVTLVACVLMVMQTVAVLRDPKKAESIREQNGNLESMIPKDDREARWWTALSFTAGICEEIIYRGFLIAIFATLFNIWAAVALSSIAFGLAHAYQGKLGIVKTGILGLAFAGLYILTGSLWAPIVLHVVTDINSGFLARRVFEPSPASASTAS